MGESAASLEQSQRRLLPSARFGLGSAAYGMGARLLRAFPAGMRHAAATPGGAAWYWLSHAQRRAALDNYAAALGRDRSDPLVAQVARRAFQNYGRMLTDFVLMGSLGPEELLMQMSIDGLEHVDAALARGRGAIMAVPHMGSWDMAGSYAAALGYSIYAVAERFPGSLNEAVVSTRQRFGLNVISLGRSAVRAVTAPRWILAIVIMVPLLTLLSVNLGILISTRVNDVRVAQQIGGLVVVPVVGLGIAQVTGQVVINNESFINFSLLLIAADAAVFWLARLAFQRENILVRWR